MRALLDVNVLIALLDADHIHHVAATQWFAKHAQWASCPITQNGCVRIMSGAGYPQPLPAAQVAQRLAEAASTPHHEFWPDSVSLLDREVMDASHLLSSRQVTDAYLLGLAVARGGRFVTFDHSVPVAAVKGAEKRHLLVL